MSETTNAAGPDVAASPQIDALLATVATLPAAAAGIRATMQRVAEFPSPLAARLTGIVLDPASRRLAERTLDAWWADEDRRAEVMYGSSSDGEVIIGSGFHAAVYAAIRVLSGHPRPIVLERSQRAGGTFAMTDWPTFRLNSRNRPGGAGLAGDQGTALNYLPGAPIQAANLSMAEYQTNTDMALVIRLTLAQWANVVTDADVLSVGGGTNEIEVQIAGRGRVFAGRVIDARGLGAPADRQTANGTTILTFGQFMQRMTSTWPLRGLRRVAVLGGGDSAKCTVEALVGVAPPPAMAAAALDSVERVDWYTEDLPDTCKQWRKQVRGRYQDIGRFLRPDRFGLRRLTVIERRTEPIALPGSVSVDGRAYDLVVLCTGNREVPIDGLQADAFTGYQTRDRSVVAVKHDTMPIYRIGPHARLPFSSREYVDGITDIAANAVSMFRLSGKTAALAATLPPTGQD